MILQALCCTGNLRAILWRVPGELAARQSTGIEPDVQTLAQRLKMKPQAVRQLQQVGNLTISLGKQANDDNQGLALEETLAGGPFASTAGAAEQDSLHRCLMQGIKILEPTEQRVVIERCEDGGASVYTRSWL